MNSGDTKKIVTMLTIAYPGWGKDIADHLDETVKLWHMMLAGLNRDAAVEIAKHIISTKRYPPTIAEFMDVARDYYASKEPSATDHLNTIAQCIKKFGYNQENKAIECLSEIAVKAVESLGWRNICESEEPMVTRGILLKLITAEMAKQKQRKEFSGLSAQGKPELKQLPE